MLRPWLLICSPIKEPRILGEMADFKNGTGSIQHDLRALTLPKRKKWSTVKTKNKISQQ